MSQLTIIGNMINTRPHTADGELKRFLHYHPGITPLNNPKVAELAMRIESVFEADRIAFDNASAEPDEVRDYAN